MKEYFMRKLMLISVFLSTSFFAFGQETGPGCGLGTQLQEGNKGVGPHVLALSTNQSSSQSSAITSGTSGCDSSATVKKDWKQIHFVTHNYFDLLNDFSKGDGLFLNAYTDLLGCNNLNSKILKRDLKLKFNDLSENLDPILLHKTTKKVIHSRKLSCSNA
jgi:hypothetical protein